MSVWIFLSSIRLTLYLNVGTCRHWGPSVTLQMVLLVKVGHGRTLSSAQNRTMEITDVWSLGLNTVWGLRDTGRGSAPSSLHCTTTVSPSSRNYKKSKWHPVSAMNLWNTVYRLFVNLLWVVESQLLPCRFSLFVCHLSFGGTCAAFCCVSFTAPLCDF